MDYWDIFWQCFAATTGVFTGCALFCGGIVGVTAYLDKRNAKREARKWLD